MQHGIFLFWNCIARKKIRKKRTAGMYLKGRIHGILAFFFLLIPLVYLIVVKTSTSRNPRHSLSKMDVMEDHRHRQVLGAPHMITLDWAKLRPNQLQDIFLFISAYHDNRMDAPGRTAIVILAYIKEKVYRPDLRCLYKFPNGSRQCLRNTIAKVETVDCVVRTMQDIPF